MEAETCRHARVRGRGQKVSVAQCLIPRTPPALYQARETQQKHAPQKFQMTVNPPRRKKLSKTVGSVTPAHIAGTPTANIRLCSKSSILTVYLCKLSVGTVHPGTPSDFVMSYLVINQQIS